MGRNIPVQIQPAGRGGNAGLYLLDGMRAPRISALITTHATMIPGVGVNGKGFMDRDPVTGRVGHYSASGEGPVFNRSAAADRSGGPAFASQTQRQQVADRPECLPAACPDVSTRGKTSSHWPTRNLPRSW